MNSLQKKLKEVQSKQKAKETYIAGVSESESSGDEDKHESEKDTHKEIATFCKEDV
ncbi:hypothetical protein E8E13_005544 [Curvularia kusanoi]|uniref:Uncharacterized protein n=1 Tax=Curvularia kusanoi TaxID=90978 RepID=A0A9P4TID3_CURKU|nr:hypothetical protein E8E13_005544 [Curvularia kusanoi]